MYQILIEGQDQPTQFACAEDDVLLRGGLRQGLGLPYECNAGGCGSCKFELLQGEVEELWPDAPGLSDRDRRKGRLLACQCRPKSDCQIKLRLDPQCVAQNVPQRFPVRLLKTQAVTHDILEVHLQSQHAAEFLPGQYALLMLNGQIQRAYSMANLPNRDGHWIFQIRKVPAGQMTDLLFDEHSRAGAEFMLDGPYGVAHLQQENRPIVCIAGGSGLAPMLSIARGAAVDPTLAEQPVWFFHGGREQRDVFTQDQLRDWTGLGERLHYVAATSNQQVEGIHQGFIHEVMQQQLGDQLHAHEIYCAGPPPMVQSIEQLTHAMGISPQRVHFDRFF